MSSYPQSIQATSRSTSSTQSNQSAHPYQPQSRIFAPTLHKPPSALDSIHDQVSILSKHASVGWSEITRRAKEIGGLGGIGVGVGERHSQPVDVQARSDQVEYESFSNQGSEPSKLECLGPGADSSDRATASTTGNVGAAANLHHRHLKRQITDHSQNSTPRIPLEKVIWSRWIHLPNAILNLHSISDASPSTSNHNHQDKASSLPRGKTLCLFLSYPTAGLHIYALIGDQLKELISLREIKDENGRELGRVLGVELVRSGEIEHDIRHTEVDRSGETGHKGASSKTRESAVVVVDQELQDPASASILLAPTFSSSEDSESTSNFSSTRKKKKKDKSSTSTSTPSGSLQSQSSDDCTSNSNASSKSASRDVNFASFRPAYGEKSRSDQSERHAETGTSRHEQASSSSQDPEDVSLEFKIPHVILVTSVSNGANSNENEEEVLLISRYSVLSNRVFSSFSLPPLPSYLSRHQPQLQSQSPFDLDGHQQQDSHFFSPRKFQTNLQTVALKKSSKFLVIAQSCPPAIHILNIRSLRPIREALLDVQVEAKHGVAPTFDLRDRILCYVSTGSDLQVDSSTSAASKSRSRSSELRAEAEVMIGPDSTDSSVQQISSRPSASTTATFDTKSQQQSPNINMNIGSSAADHALQASDYAKRMSGNLVNGFKSWKIGGTVDNPTSAAPISTPDQGAAAHQSRAGSSRTSNASTKQRNHTSMVKLVDLVASTSSAYSSSLSCSANSSAKSSTSSPLSVILSFDPNLSTHRKPQSTTQSSSTPTLMSKRPAISIVSFAPSAGGAMLLLTADEDGRKADIWEWRSCSNGRGSVWHRYRLHRGLTTSTITSIQWSRTCQWVALSTLKGTVHIYAINPFGGPADLKNHLSYNSIKFGELSGPKMNMPLSFETNSIARTARPTQGKEQESNPETLLSEQSDLELNVRESQIKPIPNSILLEDFSSGKDARLWGFGPPPLSLSNAPTSSKDQDGTESYSQSKTILDVLIFHPESSSIELNRLACSALREQATSNHLSTSGGSVTDRSRVRSGSDSFAKRFLPSSPNYVNPNSPSSEPVPTSSRISGLTQMMRRASEGISANMISPSHWQSQSLIHLSSMSPGKMANSLLIGSNGGPNIIAECNKLASWGPLARRTSSPSSPSASTSKEFRQSFSSVEIPAGKIQKKLLADTLISRDHHLRRVKLSDDGGSGSGWVSLAEMTSFSKIKGIHLPSIYLSRQFNFAIFQNEEISLNQNLSTIHRARSERLKIREEVQISSSEQHSTDHQFSTSFDLPLASAISANLDPDPNLESLSPSSRIPMFPQGRAAIGSNNWISSVSGGGIPIRSVAESLGGGFEIARRGVGNVRRRRSSSGRSNDRIAVKDKEAGSTPLSFDGEDLNEENEDFAEAMGKSNKDSGVSTSISPDKLIKEKRKDRDDQDTEDGGGGEEEDLGDEDYNFAREYQNKVESWDSLEDKSWGGRGLYSTRTSLQKDDKDEEKTFPAPEEFTLGLFDEEFQATPKVSSLDTPTSASILSSMPSKVEVNLKRPLAYQSTINNKNDVSSVSSSSSLRPTSTSVPSTIANQSLTLGTKSKSKSKKSSPQDSPYGTSPALSVKSNKPGCSN